MDSTESIPLHWKSPWEISCSTCQAASAFERVSLTSFCKESFTLALTEMYHFGVIHSTTVRSFQRLYSLSSPSILSVIPIPKLNQMCVYVKQPMLYAARAFCMTFSVKCNMSGLSYVILSTCSSLG